MGRQETACVEERAVEQRVEEEKTVEGQRTC
jgi:hypothetical protein